MLQRIHSPNHEPAVLRNVAESWFDSVDTWGKSFWPVSSLAEHEFNSSEVASSGPLGNRPICGKGELDPFCFCPMQSRSKQFFPRLIKALFLKLLTAFHVAFLLAFAGPARFIERLVFFGVRRVIFSTPFKQVVSIVNVVLLHSSNAFRSVLVVLRSPLSANLVRVFGKSFPMPRLQAAWPRTEALRLPALCRAVKFGAAFSAGFGCGFPDHSGIIPVSPLR